jgi:hypothetical protein
MASRLDDVQAALVTAFAAALTVPVYDEDPVTNEPDPQFVVVGDDWDPESEATSTFTQEWSNLAATSRYERGSIPCVAVASSGDTDPVVVRQQAFGLLASCETALRADLTLGGLVLTVQLANGAVRLAQTNQGPFVAAQFEVTYMAQV